MWPVDYDGKPITDSTNWKIKYPPLPLIEGDSVLRYIETPEYQSHLTELFTEKAVDFIERNKDSKYFLYMAHIMPHVPLAPSPKFKGRSGAGTYGDVMEELDWSVGQILDKIASTGNSRNTIVIVTSDNGPWLTFGNHAGSAGNLKEAKGTIWDGGLKVPFIIQWPGELKPGSQCNRFITHLDIMPTLLSVCGARMPKKRIDGVNIGSLLIDPNTESPRREFAYYYDKNCLKAIRSGKWKLVFPHESQTYSNENAIGNDGKPGNYSSKKIALSLYDLEADPGETNNVVDKNPQVTESLKNLARKYRSDLGDDLLQTKGANIRPAAVYE
jgi:arylsulfatase